MRILLLGATGFLGAYCYRMLTETTSNVIIGTFGHSKIISVHLKIDLTSADSVKRIMLETNPDVVIWCAKHTSTDFNEKQINQVGLQSILESAKENVRLIYV